MGLFLPTLFCTLFFVLLYLATSTPGQTLTDVEFSEPESEPDTVRLNKGAGNRQVNGAEMSPAGAVITSPEAFRVSGCWSIVDILTCRGTRLMCARCALRLACARRSWRIANTIADRNCLNNRTSPRRHTFVHVARLMYHRKPEGRHCRHRIHSIDVIERFNRPHGRFDSRSRVFANTVAFLLCLRQYLLAV